MSHVGEAEVTKEWFTPLHTFEKHQIGKYAILKAWQTYAGYEDWFDDVWCYRIELILKAVPDGATLQSSQIATTLVAWFGSNIGRAFIQEALKGAPVRDSFGTSQRRVISAWAIENQRTGIHGNIRILEKILRDSPQRITALEFEVAEEVMKWVASEEGRLFLAKIYKKLKWGTTWEIPK